MDRYLKREFWQGEEILTVGNNQPSFPAELTAELPLGAVLFRSSGSSGSEKWVVHTRQTLLASAEAVNAHLACTCRDMLGLLLPAFHVGGMGVLARAFAAGASCAWYQKKWNAAAAVSFLTSEKVTVTSMVPTQIYDLVQGEFPAPTSLDLVIVGGGQLECALGEKARALGWNVVQSYGMSEAASQVATHTRSSLGAPFLNTNIPILSCWKVKTGVDDTLRISGAPLCKGVLRKVNGEWKYEMFSEVWESNDRVLLQDNALSFLGRVDRAIKIKGELVDLDALEKHLKVHLKAEVVLVAVKDSRDGSALNIYSPVELSDEKIRTLLPPFIIINKFIHVVEIPKTSLGKLDRLSLINKN